MTIFQAIARFIGSPGGEVTWRDFAIEFFWVRAGLISVSWGRWALHIGVQSSHWKWGHEVEEYNFCADYWGLGPLILLGRLN